jgi:hypothetical protein
VQGLKAYDVHVRLFQSWQEVYVDLVQGHLQHLFLSLTVTLVEDTKVKVRWLGGYAGGVCLCIFSICRAH